MTLLVLVGLVGFAAVGALAYYSYQQAKKRRAELASLAAARGWTYLERDDRYAEMFAGAPFGLGFDRQAENVLHGIHDGRGFVAFDYRYSTTERYTDSQGRSGTRTEHHHYSVIALAIGAAVPELSVRPEGFFSRVVGRLLDNDIEFESEAFNRAFRVSCPDRKFATDVIHPQMMEYLLTLPELAWSFRQGYLLTTGPGQHTPAGVPATLAATDGILDRIPEFVRDQLRSGPPPPT